MKFKEIKFYLSIILSLIVFFFILNKIDYEKIIYYFTYLNIIYLFTGFIFHFFGSIFLTSILIKSLLLISGKNIKTFNLIRMNLIARFYQLAIPNIVSALYKLNFIKKKTNYKISAIIFVIENICKSIIFFIFGIIGILYFDLINLVLNKDVIELYYNYIILILLIVICLLIFVNLNKIRIKKNFRYKRKNKNNFFLIFILIVAIPIFIWIGHYLIILSIGNEIPFLSCIFISSLIICFSLIPFIIQGSGAREMILFFILYQLGIKDEFLIMIPFLFYLNLLIHGMMGGILTFLKNK